MRAETLRLCEELAAANQLAERAVEARLRESRTAFRSLASNAMRGIERGAEDAERMVQVGCEIRRIQLLSSVSRPEKHAFPWAEQRPFRTPWRICPMSRPLIRCASKCR